MGPVISVRVDEKGNITADFDNFFGQDCEPEENRLREKLLKYGIRVTGRRVVPKSGNQAVQKTVTSRSPRWKQIV